MNLLERIREAYNNGPSDIVILYLSKHNDNLDNVAQNMRETVDLEHPKATVILCHPFGIAQIKHKINEAYFDMYSTSPDFINKHLGVPKDKIFIVDPATYSFQPVYKEGV